MKDAGPAWMSIGRGAGKNRAIDAAREALASPLLDVSVTGARGVLFNVVGPPDLSLYEVNEAAEVIRKAVDPDANIIFGVGSSTTPGNDVHITLIATGFNVASEDGESDDELTAKLRNIKNEEEMDVPSFLRRPLFSQNRAPAPEPSKTNRPPTRSTYR